MVDVFASEHHPTPHSALPQSQVLRHRVQLRCQAAVLRRPHASPAMQSEAQLPRSQERRAALEIRTPHQASM